ncbi:MAG: hypothetical protein ACR2K3_11410 [Nocardioides sp.]
MASLQDLQQQAQELEIFGWEDMDEAELEAAIQTAKEEAKDADQPLKEKVEDL